MTRIQRKGPKKKRTAPAPPSAPPRSTAWALYTSDASVDALLAGRLEVRPEGEPDAA